jgi:hypothetical protein
MFNRFGSQSNYPQFPFSSQGSYQGTSYQGMVQNPSFHGVRSPTKQQPEKQDLEEQG